VPEAVQLAVIYKESSFRHDAKPPRTRFLWIFPGPRPSSAYGYGQVLDGTWAIYRRRTGNGGADRDDFGDVTDFIGWYGEQIRRRTGIEKDDAYHVYLAYHEGPGGFARGTHRNKKWLRVRTSTRSRSGAAASVSTGNASGSSEARALGSRKRPKGARSEPKASEAVVPAGSARRRPHN
jgi:hypothetical protein